ncbi:MAG: FKBP-type peptidyl-prolyl cis-trans isomerase [Planctomycetes bacterium]|nr:FKBP-type peptidyl-prolyl cis-trans isomerase [Planctomycetota bacterium]
MRCAFCFLEILLICGHPAAEDSSPKEAVNAPVKPPVQDAKTPPAKQAEPSKSEKIAEWIKELGAEDFTSREQAMVRLFESGAPALAPLTEVAEKSADDEVRLRAQALVEKIKKQIMRDRYLKQEGLVTLPSGLRYKILKEGDAKGASPKDGDLAVFHYTGCLLEGKEFENTYKQETPAVSATCDLPKGMEEALQKMKPGAKWQLIVPPDLAYGDQGCGDKIPPKATLVYEVELIKVQPKPPPGTANSSSSSGSLSGSGGLP